MQPLDKLIIGLVIALAAAKFSGNATAPDSPSKPPISGKGLRVLFVEETKDGAKLTDAQKYISTSKVVADYLDERCAKESTGQPAWRKFDPQQDVSRESASWRDAMKNPHEPPPWLMVSDGRKGVSRPLPKDVDATMEVLKKYGGK